MKNKQNTLLKSSIAFIAKFILMIVSIGLSTTAISEAEFASYSISPESRSFLTSDMLVFQISNDEAHSIDELGRSPTYKWKQLDGGFLRQHEASNKTTFLKFNLRVADTDVYYFTYFWATYASKVELWILNEQGQAVQVPKTGNHTFEGNILLRSGLYQVIYKFVGNNQTSIKIQSNLSPTQARVQFDRNISLFQIFIFGVGFAFIFFNFCMYLLRKKTYFIFYVGYSLSFLNLLDFGIRIKPTIGYFEWSLSVGLVALFAFYMSDSILSLKKHSPKLRRIALVLAYIAFLSCASRIISYTDNLMVVGYLAGTTVFLICIITAVKRMLTGYLPATFLGMGWAVLSLGYFLQWAALYFIPDRSGLLTQSAYLAYGLESMLFAIALAYRTRDSEMKATRDKLHALSQLEKMVYPHQIRDISHGKTLEETMPTNSAQACVISFDIIQSSQIQHIKAKEFMRNLFARCNDAMSQGYDGVTMKSAAFRIKEMGDGFLCSVGYPFHSLSDNPTNDAIDLAQKFASILREEAEILHSEAPICCGIGIALESISGFFPETGTKEYDLYGPAIVLATRYESMRKFLKNIKLNQSILIIQERVYHSIDRERRKAFTEVSLEENGLTVRDDPAAKRIYFRYLADGQEDSLSFESADRDLKIAQ